MADRWWVNDDADGDWEVANNWSATEGGAGGAGIPTASDNAYFSATSSNDNCTLSANAVCIDIFMVSAKTGGTDNYTGTLDLAGFDLTSSNDSDTTGATVTFGAGTYSCDVFIMTGGTLNMNSGALIITVNSTETVLDVTGATVNSSTSLLHISNSGGTTFPTIVPSTAIWNDFQVTRAGGNLTTTGTLDINGDLTLTTATSINGGTWELAGDAVSNDTSLSGTTEIIFNGSSAQTINNGGETGEFPEITISNTSGGVSAANSGTTECQVFKITSGAFTSTPNTWKIRNEVVITGGSFVHNSGTVEHTTGSVNPPQSDWNSNAVFNYIINRVGQNFNNTGTTTIEGDLTLTNIVSPFGGTWDVKGDLFAVDTAITGGQAITMSGTVDQNIDTNGGTGNLPTGTLTISNSGGAIVKLSNGNLDLDGVGQDMTVAAGGNFCTNGNDLDVDDVLTIDGAGTLTRVTGDTVTTGSTVGSITDAATCAAVAAAVQAPPIFFE